MLVTCAWLAACQGTSPEGQPDSETIRMEISLTGDVCGVSSANAIILAEDMSPLGPVPLQVTETVIQGRISQVPVGTDRTVRVDAFNASGRLVYSGSTLVDVVAGSVTSANVVLRRDPVNCPSTPGTGDIDIIGSLETGEPSSDGGTSDGGSASDGGIVLEGSQLAFNLDDAALTSGGIIHFFDRTADRVHRLDVANRRFLSPYAGTADAVSMAVAPDGTTTYLAYTGGRVDAFSNDGTTRFFAAAPETVSSMVVAGNYLFTVDGSGAWDSHSLYQRSTGARVATAEWRYSARAIVFSPVNKRVYLLNSGVSPTDVTMVDVDPVAGTMGAERDSPYHGNYSLPNPLRLLPDESGVMVGSGLFFNAADLTYRTSMGLSFVDVAFHNGRYYLIDTVGDTTQLRVLSSTFDILSASYHPGRAKRVFVHNGELVLVTEVSTGQLQVRILAP
ncbi:hypothetical protein [Corallococcus aberystwythensis]|uniref:Uncharacterized protein n=1 Tax=Corallococcus aberystwythensis TaxID=2316722 RepID=A0A3A8QCQ7_9BACT|nr:hypothetical protein [Corallococcus aberystwythensis]RKH64045.1 hypothetical protein D7W81_19300 [Corallococcus aberystwythensis]